MRNQKKRKKKGAFKQFNKLFGYQQRVDTTFILIEPLQEETVTSLLQEEKVCQYVLSCKKGRWHVKRLHEHNFSTKI